jgi:MFS superfamily sulfate permease-like transporter
VGSIPGIFVAFVLALINLAQRAANPAIDVLESDGNPSDSLLAEAPKGELTAPGVIMVRLAAPLFFANGSVFSGAVKRAVRAAPEGAVRHLVIDMEAVTDVDVTGAEAFAALEQWLAEQDITLAFSRMRPGARERLEHLELLRDHPVYETNRAALAALSDTPS